MATATLLTTSEVAARLRVHARTVARLVRDGELPGIRVGGSFRFDSAAVDAYLARDAADLDSVVERIVAQAPALTDSQRSRLASLLQQPASTR